MKKRRKGKNVRSRRATKLTCAFFLVLAIWGAAGEWFVHHPRKWIDHRLASLPAFVTAPLLKIGEPLADFTDACGWTGHDAVYEYDTEAPEGSVLFAGAPRRVSAPAPDDIRIIDRGEFIIGWSDKLRHPVWCAYHVAAKAKHENPKRPNFAKDRSIPLAPSPEDYTKSGYDRGHMAPNYAIVTRYGENEQRKTFLMSNIAPQTPALNRGVWRDIEHRIAEFWTARYGEIWVVVGCLPSYAETIPGTGIDVPTAFYQIIIAQEGLDVRALAVIFDQQVPWRAWPTRGLVTIEELEKLTGLDFNPDLPSFIQDPLESELPSRLWPVRAWDCIRLLFSHFN